MFNPKTESLLKQIEAGEELVTSRAQALAQILICDGCCCGRTERGYPGVPREWLKARWKDSKLNRTVQLTMSGCLGPCDLANVVCIAYPDRMVWLAGLSADAQYETLCDWARRSNDAGALAEFPASLAPHVFERFAAPEPARDGPA